MAKFLHLKFHAILLVLLAAYNQCQAQCPRLTPSNPNFGITISYDRAVLVQFATATYSDCDGESGLVNFGNAGSRIRVCNFDQVTLEPFWTGEEPTCRVLLCEADVLEEEFPIFTINYTTLRLPATEVGDPLAGGYRGGTRAEYTCPPNLGISGQSFDLCQQNLQLGVLLSVNWDIRNRTCEKQCPLIEAGSRLNFRGLSAGISYDPVSRVPGANATYECLNSIAFIPNGSLQRECIADPLISDTPFWTEPEPNCIPICQDHPPLENGVITYDPDEEFRFIGTVATYTCNEGFTYMGVNNSGICTTRVVMIGGQTVVFTVFSPPATSCIPVVLCPPLPLIPNGLITYGPDTTADFDVGTNATHTCDDNFILILGSEIRECLDTGRWSGITPVCQRLCPALPPIPNGVITYTDRLADFNVGTLAIYTCDAGFVRFGSESQLCLGGGIWSGQAPECRPPCLPLAPIPNGNITYGPDMMANFEVDTVATHSCNDDFFLSGPETRVCLPSGIWSNRIPVCLPIECPLLQPIPNGFITYGPDTTADFDVGTVATHNCNEGFILLGAPRTCLPGGIWSGLIPVCQRLCPALPPIPNGVITYSDRLADFNVGTLATYTCNAGFVRFGSETRLCVGGGIWSGQAPECRPPCPLLPLIPNGVITYGPDTIPDFEVDTVATHTCNVNFRLFGNEARVCLASGRWSGFIPVCLPLECPALPPIPNGNITYSQDMTADFEVGTVATHTCNDSFTLVGSETRECLPGGRWSGLTPVCIPRCPVLEPIPNGAIVYGPDFTPMIASYFDQGTLALYTCDAGFILVGSESRLCLAGGIWSGFPPECQPIQCPPLPMFPNGMITYSSGPSPINYPVGTEAVYECIAPEGYCLPAGATLRVCELPSGTWSGVEPEPCGRISCEILFIINGEVGYPGGSLIQDGTTVNQTCQEGFELRGSSNRTCNAVSQTPVICEEFMGNWTGQAGMCVGNFVNDTAIGDPLMTVPLNIADKTSFFEASINNNIGPNDIINLCYELHGRRDAFVNLVSDECISVNAHYELVQPNEPREDINIIDNIHVRATDSIGRCRNIGVALNEGGVCTASVDEANIADMYQANGISIRRYTNRVRIMVPNCEDVNLVMWVFCRQSTFWSTFRTDNNGAELTFQADMIKFVIARGFNLRERSHGIIGQFWNIPILVEPFTGSIHSSTPVSTDNLYQVTVEHPNERREFTAWLYPLTWEYRREYCLYAGNQQAGPVYEVESPNDPVIEGTYADYIVDTAYGTDFAFTHFNERRCNSVVMG